MDSQIAKEFEEFGVDVNAEVLAKCKLTQLAVTCFHIQSSQVSKFAFRTILTMPPSLWNNGLLTVYHISMEENLRLNILLNLRGKILPVRGISNYMQRNS